MPDDNRNVGEEAKMADGDHCQLCNTSLLSGEKVICDRCYQAAKNGEHNDGSTMYYIEDDYGKPVPASLWPWARMMEADDERTGRKKRILAVDTVGFSLVSTIFLGLNHGVGGDQVLLYETQVFGGPLDRAQGFYSNRPDALLGHADLIQRAKASQGFFTRILGRFVRGIVDRFKRRTNGAQRSWIKERRHDG